MKIPNLIDYEAGNPLYFSQSSQTWCYIPQLYLQAYEQVAQSGEYPNSTYYVAILAGIDRLLNIIGKLNRIQAWLELNPVLFENINNRNIYLWQRHNCVQHNNIGSLKNFAKTGIAQWGEQELNFFMLQDVKRSNDNHDLRARMVDAIHSFKQHLITFVSDKLIDELPMDEYNVDSVFAWTEEYRTHIVHTVTQAYMLSTMVGFMRMWYNDEVQFHTYNLHYKIADVLRFGQALSHAELEFQQVGNCFKAMQAQQTQTICATI